MAVSCCCLLAKALEMKGTVSNSGMKKAYTNNPGSGITEHTTNDKGSGHSATAFHQGTLRHEEPTRTRDPQELRGLSRDFHPCPGDLGYPALPAPCLSPWGCTVLAADMLQKWGVSVDGRAPFLPQTHAHFQGSELTRGLAWSMFACCSRAISTCWSDILSSGCLHGAGQAQTVLGVIPT